MRVLVLAQIVAIAFASCVSEHATCVDCIDDMDCGWCTSSSKCFSGDESGPDSNQDFCPLSSWIFDLDYSNSGSYGSGSGSTFFEQVCTGKATRAPRAPGATTRVPATPRPPAPPSPIIVTLNGTGWSNVLQKNRTQVESVVKVMIAQSLGIANVLTIVIYNLSAGSLIVNFTVTTSNFNATAAANVLASSANVTVARIFYASCGYNDTVTVLSASVSNTLLSNSSSSVSLGLVIGIIAGIVIVLIIAGVLVMKLKSRKEGNSEKSESLLGNFARQAMEAIPDVELKVGDIQVTISPQDGKAEVDVDL